MSKPRIVVHGENLFAGPLLDTDKGKAIEFYDCNGMLVAVFGRVLSDDFWSFATKNDNDWAQVLIRLGYLNGAPKYEQQAARYLPVEIRS